MASIREMREQLERDMLSPYAMQSADSKGRLTDEPPCHIRTNFGRDVDRIIYSKAFRRLKHKTQVFLHPEGDHYRTRLTHTLEVARIARTISRSLRLNEDLTEACALGHDLGHTPFGHAGERALDRLFAHGFRHYDQSLRVIDRLEKGGRGLNLSFEVRTGIHHHSVGHEDDSLEARVVRISDRIAYINHDTDDAIRAGILSEGAIPKTVRDVLGIGLTQRIDTIVSDIIANSMQKPDICMSAAVESSIALFRAFMFDAVYQNETAKSEERKVYGLLAGISDYYLKHPEQLPNDYHNLIEIDGLERIVCDYVSGMSDKYATDVYASLFIPSTWHVR